MTLVLLIQFIQAGSVLLNISPEKTANVSRTVRVPSESLGIISSDGEPLEIEKCTMQFRMRLVKGDATTGKIRPEMLHFNARVDLFNAKENELISSEAYEIECSNRYILSAAKQRTPWISIDEVSFSELPILNVSFEWSSCLDLKKIERDNSAIEFKTKLRPRSKSLQSTPKKGPKKRRRMRVMYKFIYGNFSQETLYHLNFGCPWCESALKNLCVLIKHLTLCHDLFSFKYVGTYEQEIRIHVFINEWAERGFELSEEPALFIPSKRGKEHRRKWQPRERQPFTKMIVYYPKHMRPSMFEFSSFRRNGFFHATTGLPVHRKELLIDSEDETDPKWLRNDTVRMIDDFTDLNSGEKAMMILWNLHALKYLHMQGKQIPSILFEFIETHGEFILANNLYRNCILHLVTLFDFEFIKSEQFLAAVQMLHKLFDDKPDIIAKMVENVQDDRKNYSAANRLGRETVKANSRCLPLLKRPQSACSISQSVHSPEEMTHSWKCKAGPSKVEAPKKPSSRVPLRTKSCFAPRSQQRKQKPSEVTPSRNRKLAATTTESPKMAQKPGFRMKRSKSFNAPRPKQGEKNPSEVTPSRKRKSAGEATESPETPKIPSFRMKRSKSFYNPHPQQSEHKSSEVTPSRKRKSPAATTESPEISKKSSFRMQRSKSFFAPRQEEQQGVEVRYPQNRRSALEHREIFKSPERLATSSQMRLRSQSCVGSRPLETP